ncbi:MAG: glycosyl hydrolase family 18 protein [Flavobacteriales bacterium]
MKNKDYYIFSFGVKTLLCFFLIFISFVVYGNKIIEDNDKSSPIKKEEVKVKGKESTFKKELKKIEKTLSFKNFFHHSDSSKLANQFIHQHHQLIKGKKDYPYNVDHEKMKLKVQAYKASTKFKLDYEVFGWYPNWEGDLYKNLNYSLLTTIAYFSYEVDPSTGNPTTIYDWETTPLIDSAKANDVKVLLTVTNFGQSNNKAFLNNDKAIKNLITQLKGLLKKRGSDGVCLDFEGVNGSQKAVYAKFISLLSQELKKENSNYLIYITVPSVDWAKSLDFEALIPVVDQFVIMGYGYYGSTSSVAGPVAPSESGEIWEPYNLSTSIDYYLANAVPSSKLIMALPYYGVMWDTKTGDRGAKVEKFIGNRTYDYIKTKVEGKVAPVQYDTVSYTAWCSYVVDDGDTHYRQCWFDNDSTIAVKLNLIKYKKLKGMGIWALGYDKGYSNLWEVIAVNLTNTTVNYNGTVTNDADTLNNDTSSTVNNSTASFWKKLTDIEGMLQEVTDYKTVLLFIMTLVVLFGGAGFVIAMFQPDTRMFFFSNTAYKIYYSAFVLLFLLVVLRWINIINDLSIALILGFIVGAVAIYFINKYIEKINKEMP